MASIRERIDSNGKKSYHVQIRIQGLPPQTKTFITKTAAKQWAAHVESEMRTGRYMPRIEAQRHTMRELLEKYRDDILIPYKPMRVGDQGPQLEWWSSRLGTYSLADITPAVIGKCRDELLATPFGKGKLRKPSTVVRYLAILSHAFSIAVKEWEWMQESPMHKVSKPKVRNERVRFLDRDECRRLLEAAKLSANHYVYAILLIALSTGMRYSEIMNIRWRKLLLDDETETGLIILEDTKNGDRRGVPLVGAAFQEVLKLRAKLAARNGGQVIQADLLFPSEYCPDKPVEIRKAWETTLKRAGIENFRFHDLRHTAASYLAMDGATAPEIAEVLGHKDLKMVKRYAHFGKEHLTKIVSRMNQSSLGSTNARSEYKKEQEAK